MENKSTIIINKKEKDYCVKGLRGFFELPDFSEITPFFCGKFSMGELNSDTLKCDLKACGSNKYEIQYYIVEISSISDEFLPFCAIIFPRRDEYRYQGYSWGVYIPKNRNTILFNQPISDYKNNYISRIEVLESEFPEIYEKMKFWIGDESEYDTNREYCIALDESFNIVTGKANDIPIPTYDLDYIISNTVNKIVV